MATRQSSHASSHPGYSLFVPQYYAAKRMLGEPTTPPFSIAAFISSEANQVRAFAKFKQIGKDGSDRADGANNIASQNAVQTGLEDFLAAYPSTRSTAIFGQHGELKNKLNLLRSALEALPDRVRTYV